MKKIEADQSLPFKLMKNKFFHREQYKELLYIVNKNIPGISPIEIIEMFKKLSNTGCSCAMFANSLVEQIYENDEQFKKIFGFSLMNKDKVDCNKLMVDIFSNLYGVMKIRFIEYERYSFKDINEASLKLLGKTYDNENDAILALIDVGINADGKDLSGRLLFKNQTPKITNYVGTVSQVAQEKFGIEGIKTIDDLKKICEDKNIGLECKDIEIPHKLTGLGTENFNFWSNYYLSKYNIDIKYNNEAIIVSDFKENYAAFMEHIEDLVIDGYSISVAATPNSIAYMHTNKSLSWTKISSKEAGHIMLFKKFDNNGDIIVSSYGEDYIIPKEYFNILEFRKIKKIENTEEIESKKRV